MQTPEATGTWSLARIMQIESKVVGRYNMHAGMTDTTHGLSDR